MPREPKTLGLKEGDRAVIDKVCGAVARCVVLVVSGRPQVIGGQLGQIDALVASWLPGSEGAGVADVLFGRRPFTGRLPTSWPRTEAQVPINVGDANYRPLYPFGWGLRTDSARDRLLAAATALGGERGDHGDPATRDAVAHLRPALAAEVWHGNGSARNGAAVLGQLSRALSAAGRSTVDTAALVGAILSAARDLAQAAAVAGRARADWPALIADADRALLTGDPVRAFGLLARVAS